MDAEAQERSSELVVGMPGVNENTRLRDRPQDLAGDLDALALWQSRVEDEDVRP